MHPVSAGAFLLAYSQARHFGPIRENTSPFSDVPGTTYVLHSDRLSGYAVRPDGELVFVFSKVPGRGRALITKALFEGATHLDCFDGYLVEFYGRARFEVLRREPNWTPGGPDVVYMALPGFTEPKLCKHSDTWHDLLDGSITCRACYHVLQGSDG